MDTSELIPNLFRTEFAKMVSVICKTYGICTIEVAEDIVSDTFLVASQTWGIKGIPDNPTAWLYQVARNKTKDLFKHKDVFKRITPAIKNQQPIQINELDFSDKNTLESQLQMLFVIANPNISKEAQIGLALRILCGFGIDEIATAFLTNKETINKRLYRAKQKLKDLKIKLSSPSNTMLKNSLESVLTVLYLLFNEGYYSSVSDQKIKKEWCFEALRLTHLLTEYPATNLPKTNALLALMCFHSSRFESRIDSKGGLILYSKQDRSLWNQGLIQKGEEYLNRSAKGTEINKYHLEAAIAYWHTRNEESKEKWEQILQLYNQLLQIDYSPIAALNRTYALSKANSKQEAINEAEKINLEDHLLYHHLLADLYREIDPEKVKKHLHKALSLAKTETEKAFILEKMDK